MSNRRRFTILDAIDDGHSVPSGRFGGTGSARCCPEHIEDHNVANPAGSFASANDF